MSREPPPQQLMRPSVTPERAVGILREHFFSDSVGTEVSELEGYDDRNFYLKVKHGNGDVAKYVLKVHNSEDSKLPALLEGQDAVLSHLNKHGIACPCPVLGLNGKGIAYMTAPNPADVNATCKHAVRLLKYVEGTILKHAKSKPPTMWWGLGRFLANMHKALEGLQVPALDRMSNWDLANVPTVVKNGNHVLENQEQRETLLSIVDAFSETVRLKGGEWPRQLVHTDANESNVLVDESTGSVSGLLDFSDMVLGWRVMDVAHAIAYAWPMVPKTEQLVAGGSILGGYLEVQDLNDAEIDVIPLMMKCRAAQSITNGLLSAKGNPSNAEYVLFPQQGLWELIRTIEELGVERTARDFREIAANGRKAS